MGNVQIMANCLELAVGVLESAEDPRSARKRGTKLAPRVRFLSSNNGSSAIQQIRPRNEKPDVLAAFHAIAKAITVWAMEYSLAYALIRMSRS